MLHKKPETNSESKQSQTIWYDEEKDKYYLINNATGQMLRVHKTGDFIKEFDASLTGAVDYNERVTRAQKNKAYMPFQTSSLKYDERLTYYTPQNDKFMGYTQFPNARCVPYFNQKRNKLQIENLKERAKKIESNYSPTNDHNATLFKYKTNNDVGVSFLTASLIDKRKASATGTIPVLKERQMHEQTLKSLDNTAKIINNKKLKYPNEKLFSTQMFKIKKLEDSVHQKKMNELEESKNKAKFDLKINTERFTQKAQSLEHRTVLFRSDDNEHYNKMNEFYRTEASRFCDVNSMSRKLEGINTRTYDGSMKLNFDWDTMPVNNENPLVRTEKMMDEKIKRQREELEGFRLPPEKQKETVITKGRFNSYIPTPTDLSRIDRALNRQVFPELYKEKEKEEKEREATEKDKKKKRLYIDPITKKNV